MENGSQQSWQFTAKITFLPEMLAKVSAFFTVCRISMKTRNHMEVACEEVLVNIIHYAYPDAAGKIEIACTQVTEGQICVRISDSGIPFDPLGLPLPDISAPLAERKTGGLGVLLCRTIAKRMEYVYEGGKNIVTMYFQDNGGIDK